MPQRRVQMLLPRTKPMPNKRKKEVKKRMYNTDSPLIKEIKTLIQSEANNNPPPTKATITKIYNDNSVDIQTKQGKIAYAKCIGTPSLNKNGLLCFADGDINNPIFITDIDLNELYELLDEKADKNHIHEPVLWNTPNYNTDYIDTSSSTITLYQVGKVIVLDFYLKFNNLPTTDTIVVNNIPTSYQPVNQFNTFITNLGGDVILLTVGGSNIYLKHYGSGTMNSVVTGMITYIGKGDE